MTRSDAENCVRLTHLHLSAQQGVRAGKVHEHQISRLCRKALEAEFKKRRMASLEAIDQAYLIGCRSGEYWSSGGGRVELEEARNEPHRTTRTVGDVSGDPPRH